MATFTMVGPISITIPGVFDADGKPRVFLGDICDVTASSVPPERPKEEEPPTEDEADEGTERDGA